MLYLIIPLLTLLGEPCLRKKLQKLVITPGVISELSRYLIVIEGSVCKIKRSFNVLKSKFL